MSSTESFENTESGEAQSASEAEKSYIREDNTAGEESSIIENGTGDTDEMYYLDSK